MAVCRADNSLLKYFAERRFHCIVLPYQNMKLCVMQKPVDIHRISNIATGMKNIQVPALVKCFKVPFGYSLNVLAFYQKFFQCVLYGGVCIVFQCGCNMESRSFSV